MSDLNIFEFLDEHSLEGFEAPPTTIAVNMNQAEGTIWQRVRVLHAAGLIDRTDEQRGYYTITEMGQRYLADELDDDEHQHLQTFDPADA